MTRLYDMWRQYDVARNALWGENQLRKRRQLEANNSALFRALGRLNFDIQNDRNQLKPMFDALEAIRGICKDPDADQYEQDILAIGADDNSATDVCQMLKLSGFDQDQRDAWFEAAREHDFVITEDDIFCHEDETFFCERDEVTYHNDTGHSEVHTSRRRLSETQTWCEDAYNNYAFYCDVSNAYYSCNQFNSGETDNHETICQEIADRHDYYYSEDSDCWTQDYDEDDDDDDSSGDDSSVPSYHNADRRWSLITANQSTRAFYGFEIEVHFNNSEERYEFWDEHLRDNNSFCGERDGSLSEARGLEVITRPFPMQELRTLGNPLQKMVAKLRDAEASGEDSACGMHITVNWGRLDRQHKERMRDMFYTMQKLTELVSGRKGSGYCAYDAKELRHNGHTAANDRDGEGIALEVRTFQSTLEWSRLMSCVEYIDAVTEWTRDPQHMISGPLAQSLFRHWFCLGGNYPNLAKRFPTQSAKELHPCVLPSSNRQVVSCRSSYSEHVSRTTPTAPASPYDGTFATNPAVAAAPQYPSIADLARLAQTMRPIQTHEIHGIRPRSIVWDDIQAMPARETDDWLDSIRWSSNAVSSMSNPSSPLTEPQPSMNMPGWFISASRLVEQEASRIATHSP